jgi:hypothetical protein
MEISSPYALCLPVCVNDTALMSESDGIEWRSHVFFLDICHSFLRMPRASSYLELVGSSMSEKSSCSVKDTADIRVAWITNHQTFVETVNTAVERYLQRKS